MTVTTPWMTDPQHAWYDDLSKRDAATLTTRERKFMSEMEAARRQHERELRERYEREQQAMVDYQHEGTHPGLHTAEGREMEDPRR